MCRAAAVIAVVVAALAVAGCSGSSYGPGLRVVASTTQLGDFARVVGGRDVSVHQILQPNTDPHEYEPRPRDVRAVAGAKVVLESGSGLDGWMGRVVSEAGGSPATLVVAPGHTPVRRPGDPHWWHDPRNAEGAVGAIARALAAADPAHRDGYVRRARGYTRRLRGLDRGIAACFARVPRARRRLVTDHDAFGYFAARYGVTVVGAVIPSQSTQAQPSARDVARLARLIRREHVSAVFPESSVNPKLARAIASRTGARSDLTLYGDTLGPKGSAGATYLSMEEANARNMVRAFGRGARSCP